MRIDRQPADDDKVHLRFVKRTDDGFKAGEFHSG